MPGPLHPQDMPTGPLLLSGTQVPGSSGPLEAPEFEPGARLAHYRILGPLGSGGFGTVWAAVDLRLEREVAIKLLGARIAQDPAARGLIEGEARAVAALSHPGIVTLHALEEDGGRLFLVMERVKGRMLAEVLPKGGFPAEQALSLGIQLADAMAAAHRLNVIHRDLNPRNVMLADDGRVKVLDFGLAIRRALRATVGPLKTAQNERTPSMAGTVPYMSPEQVDGRTLDGRSDLFSLGVVLFEMATGRRPFPQTSLKSLTEAILEGEPEWPENLAPGLASVLKRCLEKDPERRFQSCEELRRALEDLQRADGRGGSSGASVAVLPFRDLSPDRDETPFCEGMAEEILAALGHIPGLRVAARGASFPLASAGLDAAGIGRRLGVQHLVTGSVRKADGHLRITVELLEALGGTQRWTETFDRPCEDVFRTQEEIAASLARALQLSLAPRQPRRPVDLEAYEDYLRGRHFYFRYNRHGMRFALQMFQQAIERDPSYASAWAGVANASAFLYIYADRSEANRVRAEEASYRALELDPNLAEAHVSRGVALSATNRTGEADRAFERAMQLDPNLYEAAYLYARHCFAAGRDDQAVELFDRAAQLYPEDCQAALLVAQVHDTAGRREEATAARRRGLAIAEERLRRAPDDVRTRYLAANALVALGEKEKGLVWARMVRSLDPEDPMLLYNLGCIHALAGNPDEALDCLEQAVLSGLTQKAWFLHDGDLATIRDHPRFQDLLVSLG